MNVLKEVKIGICGKIALTGLMFLLNSPCLGDEANKTNDPLPVKLSTVPITLSYSQSRIEVESWNHISSLEQEFANLSQGSAAYDINHEYVLTDHGERLEINTVLVKKIINWTRQHSNGIKLVFSDKPPTIGQLEKLIFELKLDARHLVLPTQSLLIQGYELDKNQEEAVSELFSNTAYLNFTLFGHLHDNQQIASILATKIVPLPSIPLANDWFTLELNMSEFHYYWQRAWQETPVNRAEVNQEEILGLLITAESQNTKTLRHYLAAELPADFEEHFIEIPISIRIDSLLLL